MMVSHTAVSEQTNTEMMITEIFSTPWGTSYASSILSINTQQTQLVRCDVLESSEPNVQGTWFGGCTGYRNMSKASCCSCFHAGGCAVHS